MKWVAQGRNLPVGQIASNFQSLWLTDQQFENCCGELLTTAAQDQQFFFWNSDPDQQPRVLLLQEKHSALTYAYACKIRDNHQLVGRCMLPYFLTRESIDKVINFQS